MTRRRARAPAAKGRGAGGGRLGRGAGLAWALGRLAAGDLEAARAAGDARGPQAVALQSLAGSLQDVVQRVNAIARGDYSANITPRSDEDELGRALQGMTSRLRELDQEHQRRHWMSQAVAELNDVTRGEQALPELARGVIGTLGRRVGAHVGTLFLRRGDVLRLEGGYAYRPSDAVPTAFGLGEGLVGQAALEGRILQVAAPAGYLRVGSSLGDAPPAQLLACPFVFGGEVRGVMEFGSLSGFTEVQVALLGAVAEGVGIAFNTATTREELGRLLAETQHQQVELEARRAALERTNDELEQQATRLRESEEELQVQSEELRQSNEELEERGHELELQKRTLEGTNAELERLRREAELKAEQLLVVSRYKSEFLANMSHELRTPLNSLLLLAAQLAENPDGNLSERQVEYARTIHGAGVDLLALINEVLDLARIEAGKMQVTWAEVRVGEVRDFAERTFRAVAEKKGLAFELELAPGLPERIETDRQRLQQVLQNLLGNALKFTERGSVRLTVAPALGLGPDRAGAAGEPPGFVAFRVADTGIGIPEGQLELIFEAFHQVSTGSSRGYGGTGLGLSISRELARLLGGEITVESQPGRGSTFSLVVPLRPGAARPAPAEPAPPPAARRPAAVEDDRAALRPGTPTLLVIEDDAAFARILVDAARRQGFQAVVAPEGKAGLALAQQLAPDAIVLDLGLPDMDGATVLACLKDDGGTRHIPVQVITGREDPALQDSRARGALGAARKPVNQATIEKALARVKGFVQRPVRSLLVVEGDELERRRITELIGDGDVTVTAAATGAEALAALSQRAFDCVVLAPALPDLAGAELLERAAAELDLHGLPVIVYSERARLREDVKRLGSLGQAFLLKDASSLEQLLDETTLVLHRREARLPEGKRRVLQRLRAGQRLLAGRQVLVVDDDARNVFAITALLESQQVTVRCAENGREALAALDRHPDVDLVLMDVMMPELDGLAATRAIRQDPRFGGLPIIALTAKAMRGDREQCIAAGASDYISKPVDGKQLVSLLRVWLSP